MSNPITNNLPGMATIVSLNKVLDSNFLIDNSGKGILGIILAIKRNQGNRRVKSFTMRNTSNDSTYDRIITIGDLSDRSGACFVMLFTDSNESSEKLMYLRTEEKGVGETVYIMEPTFNGSFLSNATQNDLPIIHTKRRILLYPCQLPDIQYVPSLEPGITRYFSYNNVSAYFLNITIDNALCNGKFCDRQVIRTYKDKTCSCFNKGKNSSIIQDSSLVAFYPDSNGKPLVLNSDTDLETSILHQPVQGVRSWKLMNLFLKRPPPPIITAYFFDKDEELKRLRKSFKQCTKYVNNNHGWTMVGWYKKGLAADNNNPQQSSNLLNQQYDMVASDTISPHICLLRPTLSTTRIPTNMKYSFIYDNIQDASNENISDTEDVNESESITRTNVTFASPAQFQTPPTTSPVAVGDSITNTPIPRRASRSTTNNK